jgi:hypothetical protein
MTPSSNLKILLFFSIFLRSYLTSGQCIKETLSLVCPSFQFISDLASKSPLSLPLSFSNIDMQQNSVLKTCTSNIMFSYCICLAVSQKKVVLWPANDCHTQVNTTDLFTGAFFHQKVGGFLRVQFTYYILYWRHNTVVKYVLR